ncbi:FliM/FliN family flagellar motor switch protein [Mesorhizobium sp. KR9-304]|uniref:FliM/FliN family flagellar motor switch protein n=1 Tax=Mesorhizobium sp. KR9-304 TaxID=3156614 RepID=UPI0032B5A442
MTSPATPAEMRAYIIERLVGETGEPDRVTDAARAVIEKAAPAIRESLRLNLCLDLTIELKGVELARLADARPDGDGHAMIVAPSAASPDALVMTIDAAAVALIVSMLFGGDPGLAAAPISRDLSPTETVVASRVFEEVAKGFSQAGNSPFDLILPLPQAMCGADLKKHILRDGPGVRMVLAISAPAGAGELVLTVPQRLLLKGAGSGSAQKAGPATQWRQRFSEEVMRSGVELQATMPLARMTLGQVAGLRVGQVIEFEGDAQAQAKLSARQKTLFVCEFGKLGQNYTVRVRHPFDAGHDIIEGLVAAG